MPREQIGIQFGFDVVPETGGLVPIIKPVEIRHPGKRLLNLSPSRFEMIAEALDNPKSKIPDPREIPLSAHLKITTGSIVHTALQVLRIWDGLLPAGFQNYRLGYWQNLERLVRQAETTAPATLRQIYGLLADDRLALPGSRAEFNQKARGGCAKIIAGKVLAHARSQAPFVETPNFPELEDVTGLPFPDPERFNREWDRLANDDEVLSSARRLFEWREKTVIADPGRMAARQTHPTLAATELRVSSYLMPAGGHPVRWTMYLDAVERTKSPDGVRLIKVIDYKTGNIRFPPEHQRYQRQAQRAIMFLTAMTAAALPTFEPTGKTIDLGGLYPQIIDSMATDVHIAYMGLASDPIKEVDFANYYGADWTTPERFYPAMTSLNRLIATIISQGDRLEPLLK